MTAIPQFPIGYKFVPSDQELITYYLANQILPPHDCIVCQDIYLVEPHLFNWDHVPYLNDSERYYFVKRSQIAKMTKGNGKNANRIVASGVGFWRMSCGRDIRDAQNNIIGHCKSLNYHRYIQNSNNTNGRQSQKTDFLMHEYTLASENFQEWVLCRIKDQQKEKGVRNGLHNMKRQVPQQADTHNDHLPQQLEPPTKRQRHHEEDHHHANQPSHDDLAANYHHEATHTSLDLAHEALAIYRESAALFLRSRDDFAAPQPHPPEADIRQLDQFQENDNILMSSVDDHNDATQTTVDDEDFANDLETMLTSCSDNDLAAPQPQPQEPPVDLPVDYHHHANQPNSDDLAANDHHYDATHTFVDLAAPEPQPQEPPQQLCRSQDYILDWDRLDAIKEANLQAALRLLPPNFVFPSAVIVHGDYSSRFIYR